MSVLCGVLIGARERLSLSSLSLQSGSGMVLHIGGNLNISHHLSALIICERSSFVRFFFLTKSVRFSRFVFGLKQIEEPTPNHKLPQFSGSTRDPPPHSLERLP
jgi:hypothetical protein